MIPLNTGTLTYIFTRTVFKNNEILYRRNTYLLIPYQLGICNVLFWVSLYAI